MYHKPSQSDELGQPLAGRSVTFGSWVPAQPRWRAERAPLWIARSMPEYQKHAAMVYFGGPITVDGPANVARVRH